LSVLGRILIDMALDPKSEPGDGESHLGLGTELLAAVRSELADERARQASLESRAMTLAAAAAAATALIFGLGTDYVGRWRTAFFIVLGVAGLTFLLASARAWSVARLRTYDQPKIAEFRRLIDEGWDEDVDELRVYIADGTMTALESARANNDQKAQAFDTALLFLIAGVIAVAAELVIVVLDVTLS
jgi:MFS family permease